MSWGAVGVHGWSPAPGHRASSLRVTGSLREARGAASPHPQPPCSPRPPTCPEPALAYSHVGLGGVGQRDAEVGNVLEDTKGTGETRALRSGRRGCSQPGWLEGGTGGSWEGVRNKMRPESWKLFPVSVQGRVLVTRRPASYAGGAAQLPWDCCSSRGVLGGGRKMLQHGRSCRNLHAGIRNGILPSARAGGIHGSKRCG